MSKTYSAGIVTAYGAAKRAGYQGTYEDFCRQQAGYAGNAAAVEAAKTAAQTAANTATAKAGEATTAAIAAQTAKTQTEQAASQALTDISTARSGAISAVQTEGQTQTANARAQAQAAAQSATTASTKASEASASATSAGQSATNAAASATSAANAASAAQGVLESIPEDYSDLSEDVDQLKADLSDYKPIINVSNLLKDPLFRKPFSDNWNSIGTPTISETDKLNNNVTLTYGGSQVQITQDILLSELVSGTYYVSCKTASGEHLKIQVTARRKTNYYSGYLVNTEDGSATFNLDIEAIQTADPLITKLTVAFILAHNGSVTFTQPYLGISDTYNGFWNKNFADLDDIAKYPVKSAEQLMSMIAPVEVTYTATRNYTKGQLHIVDNTLYKVTANIANGGTITPNSNVMPTTLSEVIASLNGIVRVIANRDTSWAGIKENVKLGYGEILYPVGTDFSVSCPSGAPYNNIVFTVVNHRVENDEPIMTLLMKRCIYGIQFDAIQAAFVASEAMAAGTYHFKLLDGYDTGYDGGKYVQFTIVNPLVAGDQIVITWGYNQSWIGKNAYVYHAFGVTPAETCVMSEGQDGTYLGVADGSSANLNHTHRLRYGSNNWKESAVREWLNSDAQAGEWQTQQTRFQRPCSYASSKAGFMSYLDPSFVATVRTGTHFNRTNQVFDLLGTKVAYSTEERFFLLSNEEIGFTSESGIVWGSPFSYYDGANNDDRIKYDIANENSALNWWLRTPTPSSTCHERHVDSSGALSVSGANVGNGAAAACEI